MDTVSTAPWWYVAALAGGFTLLGVLVTVATTAFTSRRRNKLDDYRRFEGDIIEGYITVEKAWGVIHEGFHNHGDARSDRSYWKAFEEMQRVESLFQLIAPPKIDSLLHDIVQLVGEVAPGTRFDQEEYMHEGMVKRGVLTDLISVELPWEIRKSLRVGFSKKDLRIRKDDERELKRWDKAAKDQTKKARRQEENARKTVI